MKVKLIEAVENGRVNWGKFLVGRFDETEWAAQSALDRNPLLSGRGWSPDHLLVMDLQTGEAAMFLPGGMAAADLCNKHQIWVCPLYEPFLTWLYKQDLTDLDKLPPLVNLGDVATSMFGYRRSRS